MIWWQLLLEMAVLSLLGIGYYYFQKYRYLRWLKQEPQILAKDLFIYLNAEETIPESKDLEKILVSLEDFLEQRRSTWPLEELKNFAASLPATLPTNITRKIKEARDIAIKLYS